VVGYAVHEANPFEEGEFICFTPISSRSDDTLLGAALVGVLGAVVGGTVGAIWRTERWERAPLGSAVGRVGLAPARGSGLAVTVSF
jgi:hypothetical protein